MTLKLKSRKLDYAEIERAFRRNLKEWEVHQQEKEKIKREAEAALALKRTRQRKRRPDPRPISHFDKKYGHGKLSRGFTEMLIRCGLTIDDKVLWLKRRDKLFLKKRYVLKLRRRK